MRVGVGRIRFWKFMVATTGVMVFESVAKKDRFHFIVEMVICCLSFEL